MTVRLATSADNARIWTLFQAFFSAHPEAFDMAPSEFAIITPEGLQNIAAGTTVYVYTDASNVVQGAMSFKPDNGVLDIMLGFYNPQFSAVQVKPVIDNLAKQMYVEAGNRGFTALRGMVLKAYTAGVNYWSSYGLRDNLNATVETVPTQNGDAWRATVPLTRYAQGVIP